LRKLQDARIDALVVWGEATEAAQILRQMRAMGMKQLVFAGSRVAYPELLQQAGPAAEGLVATVALDSTRQEEKWQAFRKRYRQKFNEAPDPYAAYAYDGMNILMAAIQKTGLNRGRIMEALRDYQLREYDGVAGRVLFDQTFNNVAPVTMAQVRGGKFVYWKAQAEPANQGRLAENR
jgi:branched-chain amino acid transport system substrate-binding protein